LDRINDTGKAINTRLAISNFAIKKKKIKPTRNIKNRTWYIFWMTVFFD
jgi:hypothetical protein